MKQKVFFFFCVFTIIFHLQPYLLVLVKRLYSVNFVFMQVLNLTDMVIEIFQKNLKKWKHKYESWRGWMLKVKTMIDSSSTQIIILLFYSCMLHIVHSENRDWTFLFDTRHINLWLYWSLDLLSFDMNQNSLSVMFFRLTF